MSGPGDSFLLARRWRTESPSAGAHRDGIHERSPGRLEATTASVWSPPPMRQGSSEPWIREEASRLSSLALPIVLTNVLWMLVGTVDIAMLGRYGDEALAAASLSSVWVHMTQMLGMGLVMGMDPMVTQGHGARDREALGRALQRGVIVALLASVPVVALRFLTEEFLGLVRAGAAALTGDRAADALASLDLDALERLAAPAEEYAVIQSIGTPFFLVFIALRQYLQGRGILRPALVVTVLANLFNAVGNWALIFEFDLGIRGAGLATGLTRVFMALTLLVFVLRARLQRGAWVPWDAESLRWSGIARTLRYGFPIALHFVFEVGAFGATTLLAGCLGVTATVAHAASINLASLTFMIPLGVALAATTRIGNLVGERRFERAQGSAWVAMAMAAGVMAALGLVLFAGRHLLPSFYTSDPAALALAASVLPIAAAFQVFDGLQVAGSGILRGMGRTTPPAVFNFIAWWVIALPVAAWFVLRRGDGLQMIWWALVLGLGIVAAAECLWLRARGPRSLAPEAPGGS